MVCVYYTVAFAKHNLKNGGIILIKADCATGVHDTAAQRHRSLLSVFAVVHPWIHPCRGWMVSHTVRNRRASETSEARGWRLERERACRRERLASEIAEERDRSLSQRRIRDRVRRVARSSLTSQTRLEQNRSVECQRRAMELHIIVVMKLHVIVIRKEGAN